MLLLLLLDLVVIDLFEEGVLSLWSEDILILGLTKVDVLVIHMHLIWIITSHRYIHVHIRVLLIVVVDDLSALGLHPRLAHGRDEDAATASSFLGYK